MNPEEVYFLVTRVKFGFLQITWPSPGFDFGFITKASASNLKRVKASACLKLKQLHDTLA